MIRPASTGSLKMEHLFELIPPDSASNGRKPAGKPEYVFHRPSVRVIDADAYDSYGRHHDISTSCESALVTGDSLAVLQSTQSGLFQTCVTSPPYWSLRNYHIAGQIGLEETVADYIQRLVTVFNEVRRLLADDGTLWLNIGDSYTSGGRTWRAPDKKNPVRAMDLRPATPVGLKPKDLIGVPWRLAMALQQAGWFLRADIIWNNRIASRKV
jgi:DNA modification methylase